MLASTTSTILDFLTILRWPILIAVFLVFFFWRYRDHVGRLLDRIQSVSGPLGTGAHFGSPAEQGAPDEDAAVQLVDEQTELIDYIIHEHQVQLAQTQEQAQDVINRLLNQLATTELRADFEFVYGRIYESQIAALRTMRATPEGAPRVSVEAHLFQIKAAYPNVAWLQNLSFEDWFGFLQRNELAELGLDGLYRIAPKGMGFLSYIEGLSYPSRLL